MSASPGTVEVDPRVGTVLGGRYALRARLGEGGMGAVYRAEHLELGRPVAVKILVDELARNRTAVERFLREARTASGIGHPAIVDVFDLGRDAEGRPFLVMELLEGRDLADELREHGGPVPPARVLEVLRPIASALDVCHARGIVHRDLKPSNVFLARLADGAEQPKLVDFGLAMLFASDERLTRTGFFAGTPEYMPPETGLGELAGPSGDVYSLATMAYEMLSGTLPFQAALPNGLLVQKTTQVAPSMGARSGRAFPAALEEAIATGLATEPDDRPASATALIASIEAALEGVDESAIGAMRSEPSTSAERPRARREPATSPAKPGAGTEGDATNAPSAATDDAPALPVRRGPRLFAAAALGGAAAVALVAFLAMGAPDAGVTEETTPSDAVAAGEASAERSEAEPASEAAPSDDGRDAVGAEAESEPTATASPPEPEAAPEAEHQTPPAPRRTRTGESSAGSDRADPVEPSDRTARADRANDAPPSEEPASPSTTGGRDRAEATRRVRSASSLLIRGDRAGALRLLDAARAADPTYAPIYRTYGLVHERAGDAAAARQAYERYLRMAPGASDAARIRRRLESL